MTVLVSVFTKKEGSDVILVLLRERNICAPMADKGINANLAKEGAYVNIIVYDPAAKLVKVGVFAHMDF